MCGILGILGSLAIDPLRVQCALDLIRHRGPDDEGYMFYESASHTARSVGGPDTDPTLQLSPIDTLGRQRFEVILAHRRLSILDITSAGHQPMPNPARTHWVIFNGEVYNFVELREELARLGHAFHTGTDTEVLLAAYVEWGPAMLGRLVGMFAFAILDVRRGQVLLARDPFGIKPLYWSRVDDAFAFSSELSPLLSLGDGRKAADPESLYQYMRFGLTDGVGDRTMFAGVRQVPAAHYMMLDTEGRVVCEATPYWAPSSVPTRKISFADATAELRYLLDDSVRLHLRSDVPLGSCLSGGLDSTALVASMRAQLGAGVPIHAFSFESSDALRGEAPYVRIATEALGLERHAVSPTAENLVEDLNALIRAQEQPFDSTSIYAQYCVFRLARQAGITVMLDGQGADELFGGYQTAVSARLSSALLSGDVAAVLALANSSQVTSPGARKRVLMSAAARLLPESLVAPFMSAVGEPLYPAWMERGWFRSHGHQARQRPQGRGRNSLRDELRHFVRTLSLPRLLRYEDRNSMAFSIESRVPFCTVALADFAFSLPESYLVAPDGETKSVLRHAVADRVPRAIIDRAKVGFETPEHQWLRTLTPWVRGVVAGDVFRSLPFLAHDAAALSIEHQLHDGRALRPATWRMLNVAAWADIFSVSFTAL